MLLGPIPLCKKSKCPSPGPQVLSQIPGGGKGNRGQMATYARSPTPALGLTLIDVHVLLWTLYQQWHVHIVLHELSTSKHSFIPYFVLSNN